MNRTAIAIGAMAVVGALEFAAFAARRDLLPVVAGIPVAVALVTLVWALAYRPGVREDDYGDNEIDNGPTEMLHRWHARASMLADRADGSRADWDRHLRPLLAKEFELSSGHRITKDRRATEAAGVLQFGPELWKWVDPANSQLRDQSTRAPGRAALEEILRRLQAL
jgi:hypothetical protein